MDPVVQVGGEDDTSPGVCVHCAARAHVDAAIVRAGVVRVTVVTEYAHPRVGKAAVERAKALVCMPDGSIARGEGAAPEDAIRAALESMGAL